MPNAPSEVASEDGLTEGCCIGSCTIELSKSASTPGALNDSSSLDVSTAADVLQAVSELLTQEDLRATQFVLLPEFHFTGGTEDAVDVSQQSSGSLL